ncbi:hypothetical protein BT63DRAFT_103085 [Microthyrium microscopicum]|uniref:Uncharacterized protein n=1 Tax=Microthyrium microscopicum TaxID=703497 RepID=A0A6A6TYX1_9PEZI|nr:hypothetical protein BT63DRAFT_103085 [Microthyrium microscopicum]
MDPTYPSDVMEDIDSTRMAQIFAQQEQALKNNAPDDVHAHWNGDPLTTFSAEHEPAPSVAATEETVGNTPMAIEEDFTSLPVTTTPPHEHTSFTPGASPTLANVASDTETELPTNGRFSDQSMSRKAVMPPIASERPLSGGFPSGVPQNVMPPSAMSLPYGNSTQHGQHPANFPSARNSRQAAFQNNQAMPYGQFMSNGQPSPAGFSLQHGHSMPNMPNGQLVSNSQSPSMMANHQSFPPTNLQNRPPQSRQEYEQMMLQQRQHATHQGFLLGQGNQAHHRSLQQQYQPHHHPQTGTVPSGFTAVNMPAHDNRHPSNHANWYPATPNTSYQPNGNIANGKRRVEDTITILDSDEESENVSLTHPAKKIRQVNHDVQHTNGNVQYVNENVQQVMDKIQQTSGTIDLTNSDDELKMVKVSTKTHKDNNRIVCLGRLEPCKAIAYKVPNPGHIPEKLKEWPRMRIRIRNIRHLSGQFFVLTDPANNDFAKLDIETARLLRNINALCKGAFKLDKLDIQLKRRRMGLGEEVGTFFMGGVKPHLAIDIALNVPKSVAREVLKAVERQRFRLVAIQSRGVDAYIEDDDGFEDEVEHWVVPVTERTADYSSEQVEREALLLVNHHTQNTAIPGMEQPDILASTLMDHQKQGLHFMTEREKDPYREAVEEKYQMWKFHTVDGVPQFYNKALDRSYAQAPKPTLGGILADDMGLGKTLSIIALIASTIDKARAFAALAPRRTLNGQVKPNMKGTLIVVPKTLLEANWLKQIQDHLKSDTLQTAMFYGSNRAKTITELANADIVLTTYNILEYDSRPSSPRVLFNANWYRVVLDEAHMIRVSKTSRAKACYTIEAARRWVVTGTPIQNHISDLGSLCTFLKLFPFDSSAKFSQYIETPFKAGDPMVVARLRLIVDTMTIRRTKDTLDLPPKTDIVQYVPMTEKEKKMYDVLADHAYKNIQIYTRGRTTLGGKSMGKILHNLLVLRMFCAHKQDMLSPEDQKLLKGISPEDPLEITDDDDVQNVEKAALDILVMLQESDADYCEYCKERFVVNPDEAEDAETTVAGNVAPDQPFAFTNECYHMVCPRCKPKWEADIEQNLCPKEPAFYNCNLCGQSRVHKHLVTLMREVVQEFMARREEMRSQRKLHKQLGTYTEPSSKVDYLLKCYDEFERLDAEKPDEPPNKAVVFTFWTTHLDLIEIALRERDIKFARLDGRMGHKQRLEAITAFETDPSITFFIASIGAGGVGLNLTAANFVFIMEPQWNPQAEQQAVDRVHRIGQTRPVQVIRMIAPGSIEARVKKLGQKKLDLAKITLQKSMGKREERENKLKGIQSLFSKRHAKDEEGDDEEVNLAFEA